jgi:CubicO group peptidase (beta-lactamase class C family)
MKHHPIPFISLAAAALAACLAATLAACVGLPAVAPASLPAGWANPDPLLRQAEKPGAAMAAFDAAGTIETGSWGWADIEANQPVLPDTPFIIASVSKPFVGIAVMQLVEAGRLELDADVNRWLPAPVRNPRFPDAPITLRQLLTHRSGIVSDWVGSLYGMMASTDPEPSATALAGFVDGYLVAGGQWYRPANFASWAPGAGFEYSNPGISLAARLVELASGQDFPGYCREHIFGPLGMDHSFWFLSEAAAGQAGTVAVPYLPAGGGFIRKGYYNAPFYPAAFLKTTAGDLARFGVCRLRGGEIDGVRLLSDASLAAMMTAQDGPAPVNWQEQGLVWQLRDVEGRRFIGHTGGLDGIASLFMLDLAAGRGALIITNGSWQASTGYDRMREEPMKRLLLSILEG